MSNESFEHESGPEFASRETGVERPVKILLGEIPEPRTPPPPPAVPARIELPPLPALEATEEPGEPSRLDKAKAFVGRGYFDPFDAFGRRVDWKRFVRAQSFLFLASMLAPFIMLLLTGILMAAMVLVGASLSSATTPNPVMDFGKALSILAMLGAMLAPFTLFPFLRLVALAVLVWYTFKRMNETFGIPWGSLFARGGLSILALTFAYSWVERKVEARFQGSSELAANIEAFQRRGRKLEWPFSRPVPVTNPNEGLLADLGSFSPEIREKAMAQALVLVRSNADAPGLRFRLASRMAEMGNPEAMVFASRYCQAGSGTPVDLPAALAWIQKAALANPKQVDTGLEEAKLLFLNKRPLEGKRRLVALVRDNIQNLSRVSQFIQKEGLGTTDNACQNAIETLYKYGNSDSDGFESNTEGRYRTSRGGNYRQEAVARRIAALEQDGNPWFYRALAAEYGKLTPADADVYGEEASSAAELAKRIESGDPSALELEADRSYQKGDVARARELWLKATLSLKQDDRWANGPYYLKLAESYDPATAKRDPKAQDATKYYLAYLLVSAGQAEPSPRVLDALKRMGVVVNPSAQDQPFLNLCMKHDIPEAWAAMGGRFLAGDGVTTFRNPGKAMECFLKAQSLGYQGPQVFKSLAELDPAHAARWTALAQKP